ncbi:MAG: polyphosphate kinase 1 [Planctomycetota bacterium]|nr:polyphosphate kinase 1 [Planctomycetota bacterium]
MGVKGTGKRRLIERELSLLEFQSRVLAQAEDERVPILDRCRFAAIVAGNLDEFYMVHMALLRRVVEDGGGDIRPYDRSIAWILKEAKARARRLTRRLQACIGRELLPGLLRNGIEIARPKRWTEADREYLLNWFSERLLAVLTPLAVDAAHPFPLLASGAMFILFHARPAAGSDRRQYFAQAGQILVQVPPSFGRFVPMPDAGGIKRFALLEDVIVAAASRLLGGYETGGAYLFRVTRDADIDAGDEYAENLLVAMERQVRDRRRNAAVRLEIFADAPPPVAAYLLERLELDEDDCIRVGTLMDPKGLFGLAPLVRRPDLEEPPRQPVLHPRVAGSRDIFRAIQAGDFALFHPFHSFDPVVELAARAAEDPDVLAIKITLYRVSGDSPLVAALMRAAEAGKQVTAVVELRARFDEEANIQWARRLDAAGAHVIYGVVGYKTHSKAMLVVRREEDGIRRYVHLGTGNYNDRTARQYTDIGLLTARPDTGEDISAFFNVITGYSMPPKWNHIEMAPTGLRRKFLALIERETERHSPESPGFIRAKINSLTDPEIIEALYRASAAGVRVDLVVRGMCCLRPGARGLSENIRVVSIVDRYLEHSRIYHFRNGGNEEVYLSSADWMERNLDRRLELLFPVLDPGVKKDVLRVLDLSLRDNDRAWQMLPDGSYKRVRRRKGGKIVRAQEVLYHVFAGAHSRGKSDRPPLPFQPVEDPGDPKPGRKGN